jgi:hypothetical protein
MSLTFKNQEMKGVKFKLHPFVTAPKDEQEQGIKGYQLVTYEINYFGSPVTGRFDTKIMLDGRRLVHNGDGFFENNRDVTEMVKRFADESQ